MGDGGDPVLTQPAPASGPASLVGQVVGGRYRVECLLGEGGMGAVYRAEHIQLQKLVALKILHPEMTARPDAVARFEREAVASARIQHPHVVNATDFGQLDQGAFYLVLEYVSGKSLRQLIEEREALPPALALGVAIQIAEALVAAHGAGIVHRDLKPENVMLLGCEDGVGFVKVLDFGIAKLSSARTGEALTRHGTIFGTPEYMAPEQARGDRVDERADLYALGVILYELLSGSVPFHAPEFMSVLIRQINEPPPALPRSVPRALSEYVLSLLAKAPEKRPQTALAVAAGLRTLRAAFTTLDGVSHPPSAVRSARPLIITHVRRGASHARSLFSSGLAVAVPAGAAAVRAGFWFVLRGLGRLSARVPLDRRIRWAALAAACVPLALAAFALYGPRSAEPVSFARVFASPQQVDSLRAAQGGNSEALQALAALDPAKRSKAVWLALAEGYRKQGDDARAFEAAEAGVGAQPELALEASLLPIVRTAVDDAKTRDAALELAARRLGAGGVDLLFDVWSSTQGKTPATRAAKKLLEDPSVRAGASRAASLALEIRETRGCDAMSRLLARVAQAGDERCLLPLQRLRARGGCGLLELQDCYGCLRNNDLLETAITQAMRRAAPRFEAAGAATISESTPRE